MQKQGINGEWDYVANPRGGFVGFWWHFKESNACRQYLQIEQEKLCVKIEVISKEERATLRNLWYENVLNYCQDFGLSFQRPVRFGNGRFMTVAVLNDYRAKDVNGLLDMTKTIEILKKAEELMEKITKPLTNDELH